MVGKAVAAAAYAIYLLHAGATLSVALRRRLPSKSGYPRPSDLTGGILVLSGLWFYAAGVRRFRSLGQLSGLEEGELVTGGVYRYSRNPQIVGWGLTLLGAALAGRSAKALMLVVAYFLAHRLYFPLEERQLERAFGEEYRHYRKRVPRFLGLPKNG